jgi:serine/threonine-protein kinase
MRGTGPEDSATFDESERDETALLVQSERAHLLAEAKSVKAPRPFRVTGRPEPVVDDLDDDETTVIGDVVDGRYRLLEVVGRGGMGTVFRAEQMLLGREMALKVLPHEQLQDRRLVSRFKREAQAMSRLSSPHTVRVHDCGHSGSLLYLAMELLDGESLADVLAREGLLSWPRTCDLLLQVCESLAEAHACGVVHRDLKPANIMLIQTPRKSDFVKVLDFGLVKVRSREVDSRRAPEVTIVGA